jgi:hypothetical protein
MASMVDECVYGRVGWGALVELTETGKPKNLETNLFQSHFIHYKSHMV